jgi:hypothetical protein
VRESIAKILACAVTSLVLVLGTYGRFPYDFYTLERFLVSGVAIWIAYGAYTIGVFTRLPVVLFGGLAVLFNPLIPVHLTRQDWHPIDLVVAAIFAAEAIFVWISDNRLVQK